MRRKIRFYNAMAVMLIVIFLCIGLALLYQEILDNFVVTQFFSLIMLIGVAGSITLLFLQKRWDIQLWYLFLSYLLFGFFVADKFASDLFGTVVDLGFLLLLPVNMMVLSLENKEQKQKEKTTVLTNIPPAPRPTKEMRRNTNNKPSFSKSREPILSNFPMEQPKTEIIPHVEKKEEKPNVVTNVQVNNIPPEIKQQAGVKKEEVETMIEDQLSEAADEIDNYLELKMEEIKDDIDEVKKDNEKLFVASTHGKKFHSPTCMIAVRIPQEKRKLFTDPKEAVEKGFSPCGVCVPSNNGQV